VITPFLLSLPSNTPSALLHCYPFALSLAVYLFFRPLYSTFSFSPSAFTCALSTFSLSLAPLSKVDVRDVAFMTKLYRSMKTVPTAERLVAKRSHVHG